MKNFIDYYYNFNINNIIIEEGKYIFNNEKKKYIFKLCDNYEFLQYYGQFENFFRKYKYFLIAKKNINNSYITVIENKLYILLELPNFENYKISIFDIRTDMYVKLDYESDYKNKIDWIKMWEKKVDYFEKLLQNKNTTYKHVLPLFYYFIGIAENSILYLKETKKNETKLDIDSFVISHNRVGVNNTLYDYYDSTNVLIDHASRDISEYIKSMFIHKSWDLDILKEYLNKNKFSKYGIRMILSRIMFPTFFFDYLETAIENNYDIDLLYIETRIEEFQNFILEITNYFIEKYNIPKINWLIIK